MKAPAHPVAGTIALAAIVALGAGSARPIRAAGRFDTQTATFAVTFQRETSAYRELSTFVLPGTTLTLEAVGGPPGDYTLTAHDGTTAIAGPRKWRWTAPGAFGVYDLVFGGAEKTTATRNTITLHAFVMVPADAVKDGYLKGYPIGAYPAKPLKGNPVYLPPSGFIEVTRENEDTHVSPHFKLKQFICKEDTTKKFPKYVVLKERLLLKLEAILERVNALGFDVETLHIMSAYRTPYYNRAIGDVLYSMHQFGSAADVFVDPSGNGRMEDLNHDGVIDLRDAKVLYDEIETMLAVKELQKFEGGMGYYPATSAHPPFVHVDVRGTKARWHD